MANAVVSDWPSGVANTGWPSEPSAMLMPGRVQGWPAGTQRAANRAERLLSQAVAWWDVEQYRDGDRFLRNRGTGGELLDLRLGSSIVANSNDPKFLEPANQGYVYLSSSTANRLTTPDESALDVTDLDIRVRLSVDDADAVCGYAARTGSDPNRAFVFDQAVGTAGLGGRMRLSWYPTGSAASAISAGGTSTYATGFQSGEIYWVRATLKCDNGSGKYEVKFYKAPNSVDVPTSWTQVGSTVTGASTTSLPNVAQTLQVCDGVLFSGRVFRAQLLNSIDGTAVVDINCDAITSGSATSFTALTGQTVTINRYTSGRKSVAMPSRHKGGRPVMLLGTDDYLEVQDNWQHGLLNFAQGDSSTVLVVIRQWSNTVSTGRYLQKGNTGAHYAIYGDTGPAGNALLCDSALASANILSLSFSLGQVIPLAQVVDRASQTVRLYQRTTSSATASTVSIGSTASTDPVSIGRVPTSGASYQDFEFYAAAIFRRALSPAEIKTLSDYFTGRIA